VNFSGTAMLKKFEKIVEDSKTNSSSRKGFVLEVVETMEVLSWYGKFLHFEINAPDPLKQQPCASDSGKLLVCRDSQYQIRDTKMVQGLMDVFHFSALHKVCVLIRTVEWERADRGGAWQSLTREAGCRECPVPLSAEKRNAEDESGTSLWMDFLNLDKTSYTEEMWKFEYKPALRNIKKY
jgi:hypothetical protein